jgi:hypothetical protein
MHRLLSMGPTTGLKISVSKIIKNTLTNEHGDEVRLKKGAHVEVAVTAKDVHNESNEGSETNWRETGGLCSRRHNPDSPPSRHWLTSQCREISNWKCKAPLARRDYARSTTHFEVFPLLV